MAHIKSKKGQVPEQSEDTALQAYPLCWGGGGGGAWYDTIFLVYKSIFVI